MSASRFTFDTNVLIHAFGVDDPAKHQRSLTLIERSAELGLDCVLTLQALAEFFRVATAKKAMPLDVAERQVRDLCDLFPVVGADAEALGRAIWAVRHHSFSFWDAMLWATAREHDCAFVVTEDFSHGMALLGVTFFNPFMAGPAPEELAVLFSS